MRKNETVEEFTKRVLQEVRVDVDMAYCQANGIKFKNHEKDASEVDLFNTKSNKAAFDYILKNR